MTFEQFATYLYSIEQNFTFETFYDDLIAIKLGDNRGNGFTKEYLTDYKDLSMMYERIVNELKEKNDKIF